MYKITEEKSMIEKKEHTTYGVYYNNMYFVKDLSNDRQTVEELIKKWNEENLEPIHLMDAIEDFLGEL